MSSYSSGLIICSKTSRMLHFFGNSSVSDRFDKALNNTMKQGGLPGTDAWICPSAVLARPLEAHERRHKHPEFDFWIVVDTVAKTWRREILAGTKFCLLVLCLDQCSVGRSWTFHAKLQMRLLLCTVWDLYHTELEYWRLKANGSFFLRTTLVMHASVLGTCTPISIQRRLGSAHGCPVLVHLHNVSWEICKSWRMTEAFLFLLVRQVSKIFFESLKECPSLSAIGAQPRMMSWFGLKYQHQVFVARFHAESTRILVLPPSLRRRGCGPIGRASCNDRQCRCQGALL